MYELFEYIRYIIKIKQQKKIKRGSFDKLRLNEQKTLGEEVNNLNCKYILFSLM